MDGPISPPPDAGRESDWPLWHRLLVRYLSLHFVLYAFPAPIAALPKTLFSVAARLLPDGSAMPAWAISARAHWRHWTDMPRQWWEAALTWLEGHDLTFGAAMIHTGTIQSDTCAAWARVACIGIVAALLTALWSVLDRRRSGHPILGRWLHLGARWYLALHLLQYAWPKFTDGQFPAPSIAVLTREVGDLVPNSVVWTFMGHSPVYTVLSGLAELFAFALLLHRRTALLGACIATGVMANVGALNWLYGIPLKQFSTHLLLIAVALLLPFRHRLWAVFFTNGTAEPVDLRVVRSPWLGWPLVILGWIWAVGACTNTALDNFAAQERAATAYAAEPELFGLWRVESMRLGDGPVAHSDSSRWRDIAIDRGNALRIRTLAGRLHLFDYEEDLTAGTVTLTPRSGAAPGANPGEPPGEPLVWQVERSVVTRKGFHPAPRRPEDFRTMVDVQRQALTFRGPWEGQELSVGTVQKVFNFDQPFRLITEWPSGPK